MNRLAERSVPKQSLTMYLKWYMLRLRRSAETRSRDSGPVLPDAAGKEPVLDWLRGLDQEDRHKIGTDLMRVQFGWPIGMALVRSLGDRLWEVRSDLARNRTARLLLCFHAGVLVVLHGFIKKMQKTPAPDLELARRRLREITT